MIASLSPNSSAVLNNFIPGDLVVAIKDKGDFYSRRGKIAETQRLKAKTRVVVIWDGDDHESSVPRAHIKMRSADDDQPMVQPDDESEDPSLSSQDEIADESDSDGSIEDSRSAISGEDGSDPSLSSSEHDDDGDQPNCPVQAPVIITLGDFGNHQYVDCVWVTAVDGSQTETQTADLAGRSQPRARSGRIVVSKNYSLPTLPATSWCPLCTKVNSRGEKTVSKRRCISFRIF